MTGDQANPKLHGCYVATVTPFHAEGTRIEEGVAYAHAQWLIENGSEGLCPAGTTGEFLYLTEEEKRLLVATVVRASAGRVPVLAGVWALCAEETTRLARAAQDAGADGVFLPPPIYYPASDREIFAWYLAVHQATDLPVFAYNIPQYAANTVSLDCLEKLFAEGIIAGVKDSMGKTERMQSLVSQFGSRGVVFAASDGFATEGRRLGAAGFISAIANAAPRLFASLWNGDDSLQTQVDALRTTLKQMGSIAALKYLLAQQGFAFGPSRLPFSELSPQHRALLDQITAS